MNRHDNRIRGHVPPRGWEAAAMVGLALFVCGCPTQPPDPTPTPMPPPSTTGKPREEPSPPANLCEQLAGGADGVDDTADGGFLPKQAPKSLREAVEFAWHPKQIVVYNLRSSIFIVARNLTDDNVVVEYEVKAQMAAGGESAHLPTTRQTIEGRNGRYHQIDLQLGVSLSTLKEGSVDVRVAARLVEPFRTPSFEEVTDVRVAIQVDEDGRIYRVTYEEVEGKTVG
ncbi:MAG: hypothetical protein AAF721_03835 [Myxococcota bacterium]